MNMRISAAAALALAALLAVPTIGATQETERDTTPQMRRAHRGMMRHMARQGCLHMRGVHQGMSMGARMGGGHFGPHFLIGLKDDLELTDQQVTQLEGVHESHFALMTGMREQVEKQAEALREAREADDYDAMEDAIDEMARLRTAQAKSFIDVERQTLSVLTDAQRQKFETWKEGAELFRRQGMRQMRMHMEGEGQGMHMRRRVHQEEGGGGR